MTTSVTMNKMTPPPFSISSHTEGNNPYQTEEKRTDEGGQYILCGYVFNN